MIVVHLSRPCASGKEKNELDELLATSKKSQPHVTDFPVLLLRNDSLPSTGN